MPAPSRLHVLVLADRDADLAQLHEELLRRAARGPADFTLLIPAAPGDCDAARLLVEAVERLRAGGLDVAGLLGPADPAAAVEETWDPVEHDELLLTGRAAARGGRAARPGRAER